MNYIDLKIFHQTESFCLLKFCQNLMKLRRIFKTRCVGQARETSIWGAQKTLDLKKVVCTKWWLAHWIFCTCQCPSTHSSPTSKTHRRHRVEETMSQVVHFQTARMVCTENMCNCINYQHSSSYGSCTQPSGGLFFFCSHTLPSMGLCQ